ncbi:hypothetical protein ETD86_51490 [Nonomuraea turkmeniaca]|uniref:Uncharacterized protein n=1 Tax=Nonomuraea turkmeniaca TaxID=103838 RepID=A0A5S4EVX7_9ACTN|nr:hypothetical protein [Nonomuraea turkmeniaca]TMR07577.1 hypothetical protein ETD86_51490 [Nonomuraea turkmeniaca]
MSTPSNLPPSLILPGSGPAPQSTQPAFVARPSGLLVPSGTTPTPAAPAAPANSGFFQRLIAALRRGRVQIESSFVGTVLMASVVAVDVAAVANLGDPELFYEKRDAWMATKDSVETSRSEVWNSWTDNIATNWSGDAASIVETNIRFKTNGLFGALGDVGWEMSSAMNKQAKEVLEYDFSVLSIVLASGPVFQKLWAMRSHPVGLVMLLTQGGIYVGLLANLITQFADLLVANDSALYEVKGKLNNMRATFYEDGDPNKGILNFNLSANISDPDLTENLWVPMGEN